MVNRRRVTEEDLRVTEKFIAESYGAMKQSVIQVPSRASRSLGQTIRDHPFAAAGAAVAGGIIVYGIIKLLMSRSSGQESGGRSLTGRNYENRGPDITHEILSMMIPVVAPYVTGYIQKYISRMMSGEHDS
jgi:hypothetical protein